MKKKIIDRKSQFLTHLATGLKAWYSAVSEASEIEIQIAYYNESCIIISSNKNETAEYMYDEFVKVQAANFLKYLKGTAVSAVKKATKSEAVEARRIERQSTKLARELIKKRDVGLPLLADLEKEGKDICVRFDASEAIGESFAGFLNRTGGMADKFVALVTASGVDAHAEQKILVAMCKAAANVVRTVPVVVAGTFRPCRGCYESLSVVKKYAFPNLQFGVRPGHFWRTTTREHLAIINLRVSGGLLTQAQIETDFDENGLLLGLTDTTHRPNLRTRSKKEVQDLHYATDSESEDEGGDEL
jgi:hypothetical protein